MEKRYIWFFVFSLLAVLANWLWLAYTMPKRPPQPVAQKQAPAEAAKKGEPPAAEKKPDKPEADEKTADEKTADEKPEPAAVKAEDEAPAAAEGPEAPVAPQFVTFGSADPASPYRILVTATNQGAAVMRIEFSSPRYLDLEDRSGYLGHLGAIDAPGQAGALVQIVGRGTPAGEAGVQVGDVIRAVGDQKVTSAKALSEILEKTRPKQQVKLSLDRGGKSLSVSATLRRIPLEVVRPEKDRQIVELPVPGSDPLSMLLTLQQIGAEELGEGGTELQGLKLRSGNWEVLETKEDAVVFRMKLPKQQLEVIKRYHLAKVPAATDDVNFPAYHLEYGIEFHNTSKEAQVVAYRQEGPTGLPIEGAWYASKVERSSGSGLRDIVVEFEGRDLVQQTTSAIVDGADNWRQDLPLKYIAVDAQYFATALIPKKERPDDFWFYQSKAVRVGPVPADKGLKRLTDVSFRLISRPVELAPDQTLKHDYQLFVGPKKPPLLANYPTPEYSSRSPGTLSGLVYYGWFGWVAEPMLAILHTFYAIVRNYGIAIIMLTVLVRLCMFPLSRKQALAAQKMQELQPEIKRINEKYKKNPEQKTKAQQELFRKHNYNPLGGCLLAFVQLPIFVGLYRSLMVDVELRQAPLISEAIRWASNLAAPDMLFDWRPFMPAFITEGTGTFVLGPYFNILPLVTVGLYLWNQKMFMPPAADENARMQQKMMQYMMLFMAVLFYKVASGLCLYFIASSLWGIAERKLLPRVTAPSGSGDTGTASMTAPGGNGDRGAGKKKQRERK